MLTILKKEMAIAQNCMKQIADRKRSDRSFNVGDKVYLKVRQFLQQPYTSIPASKLSPKYFGPYSIVAKVGKVAYRLQLLEGVDSHLVFHVSLLKQAKEPQVNASQNLPPIEETKEVIEPWAIVEKKVIYQGSLPLTQVLVQWSHLHPEHTTWENLLDGLLKILGDKNCLKRGGNCHNLRGRKGILINYNCNNHNCNSQLYL